MDIMIPWILIAGGLLVLFVYILVMALLQTVKRLVETNKALLILVAGKDEKPEMLRALVASDRPPRKNIPGIATKKKEDNKSKNVDYQMTIGLPE